MFEKILLVLIIILGLCTIASLIYIITTKHVEDRVVGVNLVTTIILNIIALLTIYLHVTFIVDVAIVYAFLGFLAVVVLCRLLNLQTVERQSSVKDEEGEE